MKILLVHNYYQQRGGEDQSFEDEAGMLEQRGHDVLKYTRHSNEVASQGLLNTAVDSLWNFRTYRELRAQIRTFRPDVVHCTNTFPLISPAACWAAARERVPVVQALRNYRLICPGATLQRNGEPCELCVGRAVPTAALQHRCYRNSGAGSAVVVASLMLHRLLATWSRAVDVFYTLTQFARQKLIEGGIPAERLLVKPNFVAEPPIGPRTPGNYVVYVGRLSQEKGIETLLSTWSRHQMSAKLRIIGDGPLAARVQQAALQNPMIEWDGLQTHQRTLEIIRDAALLVMPSIWYETFGRTIIEAFSCGTPVVASRLGAMQELIADGVQGALFTPGSADELAAKLNQLLESPQQLSAMRVAVRAEYERSYTPQLNYELLMQIYQEAIERRAVAHREREPSVSVRGAASQSAAAVSVSHAKGLIPPYST